MPERMKYTLKCIFLICILCICMTACGSRRPTNAGYTGIENEAAKETDNTEAAVKEEYSNDEEKYGQYEEQTEKYTSYSVHKVGNDRYEITLYDQEHNEVYSGDHSQKSWVKKVTDTVYEIGESVGSPARYTFYFDTETAEISDVYFNAKLFGDRYIAYMEKDVKDVNGADTYTLILTDIFKKGILHQEIVRDFSFSVIADPMSVITSVEMIDDKTIRLEYFEGEDMTDVSEIIGLELNETVDTR